MKFSPRLEDGQVARRISAGLRLHRVTAIMSTTVRPLRLQLLPTIALRLPTDAQPTRRQSGKVTIND